ncbi:hypothetical protein BU14_0510s0009 [Porphyra umbilicalis]|uniref:Probable ATP-dependent transporter ycf16 n=1 Tax=Porphyra umbilicalis TaxID=2786 RepID=A0A1X6NSV9_PORUM|nr:hypothetical protein BU14_0510s0009 [Porphyra umbilicalis]|eukprot:OSX71692.1 hypothetical protein BU14_0510s0009 [Porphyra umbilicalis]
MPLPVSPPLPMAGSPRRIRSTPFCFVSAGAAAGRLGTAAAAAAVPAAAASAAAAAARPTRRRPDAPAPPPLPQRRPPARLPYGGFTPGRGPGRHPPRPVAAGATPPVTAGTPPPTPPPPPSPAAASRHDADAYPPPTPRPPAPSPPIPAPAVLTFRHLTYTVPTLSDAPLFTDVHLSLHPSQLVLLIGANGCGKSTLLALLAGFRTPSSRATELTLDGVRYRRRRRAAAALRAAVGLVPQRTSDAFLGRSVLEELTLFRDDVTTPDDVRRTLDAVGLGAVSLLAPPPSLSGGQQRRLALASQLLRQPRVRLLLLDEPLAGVDGGARRGIAALLGRVKAALPVAVVTHQPGELLGVADRVLVVGGGG